MGCTQSILLAQEKGKNPPQGTAESRVLVGQSYLQQGKVDEAIEELSEVVRLWPNCARAYLERGHAYSEKKIWDNAVADYTMATKLQDNYISAYYLRAQAYMHMGQLDDAAKDYTTAIKLDPENAQLRALKSEIQKARLVVVPVRASRDAEEAPAGDADEAEDPFAGLDTPTSARNAVKQCMICMDAERGCRLRPCLHAALCVSCGENLKGKGFGCPICNVKIEAVEQGAFMRTFALDEAQGLAALALRSPGAGGPSPSPTKSPGRMSWGTRMGSATGPAVSTLPQVEEEPTEGGPESGPATSMEVTEISLSPEQQQYIVAAMQGDSQQQQQGGPTAGEASSGSPAATPAPRMSGSGAQVTGTAMLAPGVLLPSPAGSLSGAAASIVGQLPGFPGFNAGERSSTPSARLSGSGAPAAASSGASGAAAEAQWQGSGPLSVYGSEHRSSGISVVSAGGPSMSLSDWNFTPGPRGESQHQLQQQQQQQQ